MSDEVREFGGVDESWLEEWLDDATKAVESGPQVRYCLAEVSPAVIAWPIDAEDGLSRKQVAFPITRDGGGEAAMNAAKDYVISRGLNPALSRYGDFQKSAGKNIFFPGIVLRQHTETMLNIDTSEWDVENGVLDQAMFRRNTVNDLGEFEEDRNWSAVFDRARELNLSGRLNYGVPVWVRLESFSDAYYVGGNFASVEEAEAAQYNRNSFTVSTDGENIYPRKYWNIAEVFESEEAAVAHMEGAGITQSEENGTASVSDTELLKLVPGEEEWPLAAQLDDTDKIALVNEVAKSLKDQNVANKPGVLKKKALEEIASGMDWPVAALEKILEAIVLA